MRMQSQIKRTLRRPQGLARVCALMREAPEAHRTALADRVCADFGFIDARGRPQRAGCLKALRGQQLHQVVGLNRFLIRRGVICRNLASHVLGRALRRLSGAFETRCAYRPYQVEPFVEHPRHSGVSLRASNWRYVGETSGRGRQDRGHAAQETTKAIHLYALDADWRARLRLGPAPSPSDAPLAPAEGLDAEHWAQHAFGGAPLGDQ